MNYEFLNKDMWFKEMQNSGIVLRISNLAYPQRTWNTVLGCVDRTPSVPRVLNMEYKIQG